MNCNKVEASCQCIRDKDHEGPHVCDCGGVWEGSMFNNFKPYAFPIVEGTVAKEEADDYASKTMARYFESGLT